MKYMSSFIPALFGGKALLIFAFTYNGWSLVLSHANDAGALGNECRKEKEEGMKGKEEENYRNAQRRKTFFEAKA